MLAVVVVAVALLAGNAPAEPPPDELIRTYLVDTGARAAYEFMLSSMPSQMATISKPLLRSFGESLRQQGYSGTQVTSATAAFDRFMAQFAKDTVAEIGKTASWETLEAQVY